MAMNSQPDQQPAWNSRITHAPITLPSIRSFFPQAATTSYPSPPHNHSTSPPTLSLPPLKIPDLLSPAPQQHQHHYFHPNSHNQQQHHHQHPPPLSPHTYPAQLQQPLPPQHSQSLGQDYHRSPAAVVYDARTNTMIHTADVGHRSNMGHDQQAQQPAMSRMNTSMYEAPPQSRPFYSDRPPYPPPPSSLSPMTSTATQSPLQIPSARHPLHSIPSPSMAPMQPPHHHQHQQQQQQQQQPQQTLQVPQRSPSRRTSITPPPVVFTGQTPAFAITTPSQLSQAAPSSAQVSGITELFTVTGEPPKKKRGRKPNLKEPVWEGGWTFLAPTVSPVPSAASPTIKRELSSSGTERGASPYSTGRGDSHSPQPPHLTIMHHNHAASQSPDPMDSHAFSHLSSTSTTFTASTMDPALSTPKKKRGRKPKNPITGNSCFVWKEIGAKSTSSMGPSQLGPIILPKNSAKELFFVPETPAVVSAGKLASEREREKERELREKEIKDRESSSSPRVPNRGASNGKDKEQEEMRASETDSDTKGVKHERNSDEDEPTTVAVTVIAPTPVIEEAKSEPPTLHKKCIFYETDEVDRDLDEPRQLKYEESLPRNMKKREDPFASSSSAALLYDFANQSIKRRAISPPAHTEHVKPASPQPALSEERQSSTVPATAVKMEEVAAGANGAHPSLSPTDDESMAEKEQETIAILQSLIHFKIKSAASVSPPPQPQPQPELQQPAQTHALYRPIRKKQSTSPTSPALRRRPSFFTFQNDHIAAAFEGSKTSPTEREHQRQPSTAMPLSDSDVSMDDASDGSVSEVESADDEVSSDEEVTSIAASLSDIDSDEDVPMDEDEEEKSRGRVPMRRRRGSSSSAVSDVSDVVRLNGLNSMGGMSARKVLVVKISPSTKKIAGRHAVAPVMAAPLKRKASTGSVGEKVKRARKTKEEPQMKKRAGKAEEIKREEEEEDGVVPAAPVKRIGRRRPSVSKKSVSPTTPMVAAKKDKDEEASESGAVAVSQPASAGSDIVSLEDLNWHASMQLPDAIWKETVTIFDQVRQTKEMRNRHPNKKRNHILASILYILCRQQGYPRTFSEICGAAGVKKQEIGTYYRLMLKILEPSGVISSGSGVLRVIDAQEHMKRWCRNLALPESIAPAAIHVFGRANDFDITTGKCPISVGAASIWLCCQAWNEARRDAMCDPDNGRAIRCDHKDVANTAGVVNATLVGCFKMLLDVKDKLLPEGFIEEARKDSSASSRNALLAGVSTNLVNATAVVVGADPSSSASIAAVAAVVIAPTLAAAPEQAA